MHYYKFNIPAWGLSTAHLTVEEEGIYLRLINHYYDTECPIPQETQSVIRRLRLETQSVIASAILEEFFTLTDKGWVHNKCEIILKAYRRTGKKNRKNGALGGRPKKDAACSETQTKPSGLNSETQTKGNYKLRTKNEERRTINQKDNQPPMVADSLLNDYQDYSPQLAELATEFIVPDGYDDFLKAVGPKILNEEDLATVASALDTLSCSHFDAELCPGQDSTAYTIAALNNTESEQ